MLKQTLPHDLMRLGQTRVIPCPSQGCAVTSPSMPFDDRSNTWVAGALVAETGGHRMVHNLPRESSGSFVHVDVDDVVTTIDSNIQQLIPAIGRSARTLLGAPGIATRSKEATRGSWPYY